MKKETKYYILVGKSLTDIDGSDDSKWLRDEALEKERTRMITSVAWRHLS